MRIHHGTADTTLYPQNYYETIKQWTGIFGYSTTATTTYANDPKAPYTRYVFGPNVEGVLGAVSWLRCSSSYFSGLSRLLDGRQVQEWSRVLTEVLCPGHIA
jgi:hypothetical protein